MELDPHSPGEIKRKNVEMDSQESRRDQEEECGDGLSRVQARSRGRMWSWTLKSAGEIKRKNVELDPHSPGEIKRKNVEMDSQDSRRDKEAECGAGPSRVQARSRGRIWSWTLKSAGEIKRKNVELDPHSPGEIKRKNVEMDSRFQAR